MGRVHILRIVVSLFSAIVMTLALCLVAPLISREKPVVFSEAVSPVRVVPLPPLKPQKNVQKIQEREIMPLPRVPPSPKRNEQLLEKMDLSMMPLQLELPPMQAASIPAAPSQDFNKKESGMAGTGVYELGMVDSSPKLRRYIPPLYPPRARGKRIEGKVLVRCVVTADGRVKDGVVVSATPPGYFEEAALAAIARWTFIPARYLGEKVPVYVDIPLSFTLK